MKRACYGWIVLCTLFATQGCRAPSPDWNGTWKLNLTKSSSHQGQVLAISISADDEYRFDENSSQTIRCDGKELPIGNNRTLRCEKSGVTALDITINENGVKTIVTHDELSADGNSFTTTVTEFRRSGPVIASQVLFSRLSGSNGFAGQWLDTTYLQQHADMTLSLDRRTLHIGYPNAGQYVDAPLDGVETPVQGPRAPKGVTYAVRLDGKRKFLTLTKLNDKVHTQGSLELSDDGRVITDSWWNPDKPTDKGTLVYEKK